MLKDKNIILGVTGSIAAYKAASLASMLVKSGADVRVIMTRNACNIINPITFETLTGHKCMVDTFDRNFEFKANHVSFARMADIIVVAPATANSIAKFAHGIADDMLSSTFLACSCPKLLCPAMNTAMYENPITQDNLATCRKYGMDILEPADGYLACGDTGKGKMPEPEAIFTEICRQIQYEKDLSGKKIIITAGPTRESLDPVRYITNHSTGKMGYALARVASFRGADVTLISGPTSILPPPGVKTVRIQSAREMFEAVKAGFPEADIVIKAAAVADYRPKFCGTEKLKKKDSELTVELERTDDILAYLGQNKGSKFLCGFSMETQNMVENSRAKLEKKNLDMIVANNLKQEGAGFGTDTNIVTIITRNGQKELPVLSKDEVAGRILDEIKERI